MAHVFKVWNQNRTKKKFVAIKDGTVDMLNHVILQGKYDLSPPPPLTSFFSAAFTESYYIPYLYTGWPIENIPQGVHFVLKKNQKHVNFVCKGNNFCPKNDCKFFNPLSGGVILPKGGSNDIRNEKKGFIFSILSRLVFENRSIFHCGTI